jgi:hypothetical protein
MSDDGGWREAASRSWADDLLESDPRIRAKIDEWWATTPREPMVGSRHHTVPRSYLGRFSKAGQLYVRDRVTGAGGLRNTKDTGAIKDFYTFVNIDGERDGRIERILSDVEGSVDTVFKRLLNPFLQPRPLDQDEHLSVSIFLAFQLVRTPRHRREFELMGDYLIRSTNASTPDIGEIRVVPDPNLHLEYFTRSAPRLAEALFGRPSVLVTIDRPLFITGDEPVILEMPDGVSHVQHLPTCSPPDRRGLRRSRRRENLAYGDTVHTYPNRPGVEQAAEVAIPLTPQALLVLGTKAEPQGPPHYHLAGADAMSLADKVNGRVLLYAYQWVAAHPEHPTFAGMVFPDLEPVIRVCDGGSQFAHDLDRPPDPRQPQLLGRRGS